MAIAVMLLRNILKYWAEYTPKGKCLLIPPFQKKRDFGVGGERGQLRTEGLQQQVNDR